MAYFVRIWLISPDINMDFESTVILLRYTNLCNNNNNSSTGPHACSVATLGSYSFINSSATQLHQPITAEQASLAYMPIDMRYTYTHSSTRAAVLVRANNQYTRRTQFNIKVTYKYI